MRFLHTISNLHLSLTLPHLNRKLSTGRSQSHDGDIVEFGDYFACSTKDKSIVIDLIYYESNCDSLIFRVL